MIIKIFNFENINICYNIKQDAARRHGVILVLLYAQLEVISLFNL